MMFKVILTLLFIHGCFSTNAKAYQQNKTAHHVHRDPEKNVMFQKITSYRSFKPVGNTNKYHTSFYPKPAQRVDYDLNAYDSEYGGVVSNFSSSVYDDNPPIYPNPELLASDEVVVPKSSEKRKTIPELDMPDNSLADGDLKDHNIIDSVTYLYGCNNRHTDRNDWIALIIISSGLTVMLLTGTCGYLICTDGGKPARDGSRLYPIVINLCITMLFCTCLYVRAIVGEMSPDRCEKVAILLHYAYLTCLVWMVLISASVLEYTIYNSVISLNYQYFLAYGVPAIIVEINYALAIEQYEIKHYCWMSIEKGMVMGFMVPAMLLILMNTGIVMKALQIVQRKEAEHLTAKIQELVDHHVENWPKDVPEHNESVDVNTPGSSRKNTDTSDNLDNNYSDDECQYVSVVVDVHGKTGNEQQQNQQKPPYENHLINVLYLYLENLVRKPDQKLEIYQMKTYLNMCLVMIPFFSVNWVLGVLALENATYWPTPALYLVSMQAMNVYLCVTLCRGMPPLVPPEPPAAAPALVITPPYPHGTRTTDSIPLLDPSVQQPVVAPAPADTISTISI